MPIVLGVSRQHEFTGNDLNGRGCIFPREVLSPLFVQLTDFKTKLIKKSADKYLAFPFFVRVGESIIGLFSSGSAHAQSENQVMVRSDDKGETWRETIFTGVDAPVYDLSLLTDLLAPGQFIVLKAWSIRNIGGTIQVSTVSSVQYGGLSYGLWSKIVPSAVPGKFYRTGYAFDGTNTRAALFQTTDQGLTWTYVSSMFQQTGLSFSEADIVRTSGNNLISVCREDTGDNNPLYSATSSDDGATWSSPTMIPTSVINGRQPNIIKTTSGKYVLTVGDRVGVSGISGGGSTVFGADKTGIALVTSSDGQNWGTRTMLAGMYSTDGGQPFANEILVDRLNIVFYQRRSVDSPPVIQTVSLDISQL